MDFSYLSGTLSKIGWPTIGAAVAVIVVLLAATWYFLVPAKSDSASAHQDEGFGGTSPGTLSQLSANHVPTEEDIEASLEEQKRAIHEADEMTSEQPPLST